MPQRAQNVAQDDIDVYHSPAANGKAESRESSQLLEERFGRNLDISFVDNAKSAICRRIAGYLVDEVDLTAAPSTDMDLHMHSNLGLSENDAYFYPCGMNSIFHTHRMLLEARGPLKSISFTFPYVDTLKTQKSLGRDAFFTGKVRQRILMTSRPY
jgi:cystathionine gamma-synthase